MFTGLIEGFCKVKTAKPAGAGAMQLTIDLGKISNGCRAGDSISVNGVCLTIAKLTGNLASFDVSGETLSKSTLGKLKASSFVNIERAVAADGRFGGHFVLGHVDGVAAIKSIERKGKFANITFAADKGLLENMMDKGSVAVDGISLTISKLDKKSFSVALIPETIKRTTLGIAKAGQKVNIETDIIIKTIKKYLDNMLPAKEGLTIEKLRSLGF